LIEFYDLYSIYIELCCFLFDFFMIFYLIFMIFYLIFYFFLDNLSLFVIEIQTLSIWFSLIFFKIYQS